MVAKTISNYQNQSGSAQGFEGTTPARAQSPESAGEIRKGKVIVKLNDLPKDVQGYHSVTLLEGILVDEGPEGEIIFDQLIYTWNIEPDDLRVCAWLGDSWRDVDEAKTLQEALQIALKDYLDSLKFMPKKPIKVVE